MGCISLSQINPSLRGYSPRVTPVLPLKKLAIEPRTLAWVKGSQVRYSPKLKIYFISELSSIST
jgi:hypothetical protein